MIVVASTRTRRRVAPPKPFRSRTAIDSRLVAALLVAAYRTVASETVRLRLDGVDLADVAAGHRQRLDTVFASVARAISPAHPADEA